MTRSITALLCAGAILITSAPLFAGFKKDGTVSLSLDEIKQGCSPIGALNLNLLVKLQVGDKVQITTSDNNTFLFLINSFEVSEEEQSIRIYGESLSSNKEGKIGLVFTKSGIVAGAIVIFKEKQSYIITESAVHQGLIFQKKIEPLSIQ